MLRNSLKNPAVQLALVVGLAFGLSVGIPLGWFAATPKRPRIEVDPYVAYDKETGYMYRASEMPNSHKERPPTMFEIAVAAADAAKKEDEAAGRR